MMKRIFLSLCAVQLLAGVTLSANGLKISSNGKGNFAVVAHGRAATIAVAPGEPLLISRVAQLLADDVERVTAVRPAVVVTAEPPQGSIVVATIGKNAYVNRLAANRRINTKAILGGWERYLVKQVDGRLVIVGSDRRGAAYGALSLSEVMGVSPWYWWADVPVKHRESVHVMGDYISESPTVKYRGIFINDEDWGMKPWAAKNYERKLGDIGPKTYARVCELLLRLRGNMLAPAMHGCTGAFYSHPESKLVCDSFGIIITTSHCEPLLLNNAARSEWNVKRDGDWNYQTNRDAIIRKWDNRLGEASKYENIYTTAMRGLHDAGLRGNLPMNERVALIDTVMQHQRQLLKKHIGKKATDIPQIFVPYKETMDIYENGLKVPDDVTLVWVDDNYGYMKRVSSPEEQKRSGGSGIYYHLSYLGGPHDYLWLNTTPPVLMYEELRKAYDHGADRYWLLNVGDIKPMELGIQTFMDMAWNIHAYDFERVHHHQADYLTRLYGQDEYQPLLDAYYRLAWTRKPEFMGYEREWDDAAHTGLRATDFAFANGEAQRRLADYEHISTTVQRMADKIARTSPDHTASFFELVQFPIQAAYQMNRKFLMAQLNQELAAAGRQAAANWAAQQAVAAYDSIDTLNRRYNELLNGKWRGMMTLPPGWCALYHKMPALSVAEDIEAQPIARLQSLITAKSTPLTLSLGKWERCSSDIRLVKGMGSDWQVVQLGSPSSSPDQSNAAYVEYTFPTDGQATSVAVELSVVPFWPVHEGRENRISVSVDGGEPQIFNNLFKEYSLPWKDQVLVNAATTILHFAVDPQRRSHRLTISAIDPGQMIQKITIKGDD